MHSPLTLQLQKLTALKATLNTLSEDREHEDDFNADGEGDDEEGDIVGAAAGASLPCADKKFDASLQQRGSQPFSLELECCCHLSVLRFSQVSAGFQPGGAPPSKTMHSGFASEASP